VRVWVVGLGTVGRWLLSTFEAQSERLAAGYGLRPVVVGAANARDGFVHDPDGLEVPTLLRLVSSGRPLTDLPDVQHWPTALDGLRTTEADVLVEVSSSPAVDGEPGFTHMREALRRRIPVVTSNKWPVALHGVELAGLAHSGSVSFRAESTVMSGTPVLSTLVDGLAGTTPVALRGILNATANFILGRMAAGVSYEAALTEAQETGLAERDPTADVEGHDAMAKAMILAALVFGRQLLPGQVERRGITGVQQEEIEEATAAGARIGLVATLELSDPEGEGDLSARVEPELLHGDDPLASIEGSTNAVVCTAEPVGEVTVIGPGAGPALAGQGVLSDLIAVAITHRSHERGPHPDGPPDAAA
jgi:homoserine dehydrogenase